MLLALPNSADRPISRLDPKLTGAARIMKRPTLSISMKIGVAVGALVLALAVIGVSGLRSAGGANEKAAALSDVNVEAIIRLGQLRAAQNSAVTAGFRIVMASPDETVKLDAAFDEAAQDFKTIMPTVREVATGETDTELLDAIQTRWDGLLAAHDSKRWHDAATTEQVREAGEDISELRGELSKAFNASIDEFREDAQEQKDLIAKGYERQRTTSIALILVGIAIGIASLVLLSRSLVPRIREYASFAKQVADGDLTARVEPRGGDQLTDLADTLNEMGERLATQIRSLQDNAQTVSAGTNQILAAAEQQSASATHQSASVSQTTSAVEELRATAEHAAAKADEVTRQASEAVSVGDEGARAVDDIVAGMHEIQKTVEVIAQGISELSQQTQQIAEITATVGDLADQSNLLALNATIEAAKAGEQGKGFAVVADEVRNLAEQSKQATAQVETVLEEITRAANTAVHAAEVGQRTVQDGASLAERAGTIIEQLVSTSRRTDEAAQQIAATAQQQNVGMDQIAEAMKQTSQATSQFVAGADQSREAAGSLQGVAQELQNLAASYRL